MQAQTTDADKPLAPEASLAKKYNSTRGENTEDAEQSGSEDYSDEEETKSRCFPIELFKCCTCLPPTCVSLIPGHFRKVQNFPHLILIIGVIASLALLIDTIVTWWFVIGKGCRTPLCLGRILPVVFVFCCLMYFVSTIQQYDEDLQKRQRQIVKAKAKLSRRYQEIVSELDDCVKNSMDTQASLAERNFESKRRDFQRFLHKISKDFKDHAPGTSAEAREQFQQFREFVREWFVVFSECSMDPVNKPCIIVKQGEFDNTDCIKDTAALASERLKQFQVRIISGQQAKDKEDLSGFRFIWKRLTDAHDTKLNARRRSTAKMPICDVEAGMTRVQTEFAAQSSKQIVESIDKRWFQPGGTPSCCACVTDQADETGYPRELHMCRVKIVFLSQEHVKLMIAFVVGLIIMFIEAFLANNLKIELEVEVSVSLICIAFVLYEFIDLDIVQQLDRQLKEVEVEQKKLDEKRTTMLAFYERTQQLADVWLHRTTPRLELMKQFSEGVEDMPARNFGTFLAQVNTKARELDNSLPSLDLWVDEKSMVTDQMKVFGDSMNDLTRSFSVDETLQKMPQCSQFLAQQTTKLRALAAPAREVSNRA